jgi:hypothetical protein
MKVGSDISFVEFTYIAKEAVDSPRAGDISCSVIVSSDTFRGEIPSVWFSREDLDHFLKALEQLERTRQGLVKLTNLSSLSKYNPLIFEIFSIDSRGNVGVNLELVKLSCDWEDQAPFRVVVSFPLDGERFGAVVEEFRNFFGSTGKRV